MVLAVYASPMMKLVVEHSMSGVPGGTGEKLLPPTVKLSVD